MTTAPHRYPPKQPGECAFADCTNPATVEVERQRRCGHTEQPNLKICGTCAPAKSPRPSPCSTCGEWNHIHSITA